MIFTRWTFGTPAASVRVPGTCRPSHAALRTHIAGRQTILGELRRRAEIELACQESYEVAVWLWLFRAGSISGSPTPRSRRPPASPAASVGEVMESTREDLSLEATTLQPLDRAGH